MKVTLSVDQDSISFKTSNMKRAHKMDRDEFSNLRKGLFSIGKYMEKGIAKVVVEDGVITELVPNREKQQMFFKAILDDIGESLPTDEEE